MEIEMSKNKLLVSLAKYSVVKKLAADCISNVLPHFKSPPD